MNDVRNALRQWKRSPGITSVVLLSLALGIGGNLALFSLVDALVLRKLPIHDPDRLVRIIGRDRRPGEQHDVSFSTNAWQYFREHQAIFNETLAIGRRQVNLARGGEARFVSAAFVESSYFGVLGVAVQRGRGIQPSDERPDAAPVAVISDGLWRRDFGARDAVLGTTLHLDDQPFTIVGIAPRGFFGLEVGRVDDVIVPMATQDILYGSDSTLRQPLTAWLQIYARLAPGMSLEAAAEALAGFYPAFRAATIPPGSEAARYMAYPLDLVEATRGQSFLRRAYAQPLTVLLGAIGVVLLIACINLAVLSMARVSDREQEIGIRLSLGASRRQLVRLLLTESLLLSIAGGIIGLAGGVWLARAVAPYLSIARVASGEALALAVDVRLAAATIVIVLVTGALAGLLPAWRASRLPALASLGARNRGGTHQRRTLALMRALAGGQVALSVVLVIGAALLVRSFVELVTRPTGVDAAKVLVAAVGGSLDAPTPTARLERIARVRDALARVPGVDAVSAGSITPLSGMMAAARMEVPGSQAPAPAGAATPFNRVWPGFFDVVGTPLLQGRDFNEADAADGPPVAIVNRAFAERHWGGLSPIGRILIAGERSIEIVGVVANSRQVSLREPNDVPMAYGPIAQWATVRMPNLRFALRTEHPEAARSGVAAALRDLDPRLSVEFRTMQDEAQTSIDRERMLAWAGGLFASLGLLMAIIGLYGTFAYAVVRRRTEIGVRVALGAGPTRVLTLFLREAALVVSVGLIAGTAAALAGARWIQSLLFGIDARHVETLLIALASIIVAAALATYLPARRAASVQPAVALRSE